MNQAIIDRLWVDDEPKVFVTKEQYVNNLVGWEAIPYEVAGKLAFVAMVNGPAFHFHSFETGFTLPMSQIRSFLQNLIDEHGYAETKTPHDDERQHRFNKLIGFVEAWRDEFDVIYRIERVKCRSSQ